jgi:general L-amino acid transport system substrate-binding protein
MHVRSIGAALVAFSILAAPSGAFAKSDTLVGVQKRDRLICAVNGTRDGFSALNSKGEWAGFDIDFCKAIAAATIGDSTKIEPVKSTSKTRFTMLQTGEVDVTLASATWTLKRDTTLGLDFTQPIYYEGQAFMVNKSLGAKTVDDLDGATACVRPGSTSEKTITDVFRTKGLSFTPIVIDDQLELNRAFFSGRCDVMVQGVAGLSAARVAAADNPADFVFLPGVYGKDPTGPVVRQTDPQWRDIVNWVVFAVFSAEEYGVTSKNVDAMLKSKNPDIQRLLGVSGKLGEALGLSNDFAYKLIKQVGNYGEIWERNIGKNTPLSIPRGRNVQYTKGGLFYAPPFK